MHTRDREGQQTRCSGCPSRARARPPSALGSRSADEDRINIPWEQYSLGTIAWLDIVGAPRWNSFAGTPWFPTKALHHAGRSASLHSNYVRRDYWKLLRCKFFFSTCTLTLIRINMNDPLVIALPLAEITNIRSTICFIFCNVFFYNGCSFFAMIIWNFLNILFIKLTVVNMDLIAFYFFFKCIYR